MPSGVLVRFICAGYMRCGYFGAVVVRGFVVFCTRCSHVCCMGMVCREGGHGWVHFLLSRSLHIDVVQCARVRMLVFSHCNLFFVFCSCLIVSL